MVGSSHLTTTAGLAVYYLCLFLFTRDYMNLVGNQISGRRFRKMMINHFISPTNDLIDTV